MFDPADKVQPIVQAADRIGADLVASALAERQKQPRHCRDEVLLLSASQLRTVRHRR